MLSPSGISFGVVRVVWVSVVYLSPIAFLGFYVYILVGSWRGKW